MSKHFVVRWAFNLLALIVPVTMAAAQTTTTGGEEQEEPPKIINLPGPSQERSHWDRVMRWWDESVFERIKISGYRNLGYHIQEVSGDTEAFELGNYGGQGGQRFTDIGFLRFTGVRVFGNIDFEANLQDSRFQDPQAQRYRLKFSDGPWIAEYGDIYTRMPGSNPFVQLGKQLTGVSAGYKAGGLEIQTISSDARGQARTVSIQGKIGRAHV